MPKITVKLNVPDGEYCSYENCSYAHESATTYGKIGFCTVFESILRRTEKQRYKKCEACKAACKEETNG